MRLFIEPLAYSDGASQSLPIRADDRDLDAWTTNWLPDWGIC